MKKTIVSTISVLLFAMGALAHAGTLQEGVSGLTLGMTVNETKAVLAKLAATGKPYENCEAATDLGPDYETCTTIVPGATYRNMPVGGFNLDFKANRLQSIGVYFAKIDDAKALKAQGAALTTFFTGRLGKPELVHKSPEWTLDDGSILGLFSAKDLGGFILMEREHYALMGKMARKSDAQKADI